jgi:ParB family transcriptional regulator, chromosome partitioning protein
VNFLAETAAAAEIGFANFDTQPSLGPLMAKSALGKGLGALISAPQPSAGTPAAMRMPTLSQPAPGDVIQKVALSEVVASPLQPRKDFASEQLNELVASIREHGIIQPLIVRRVQGKLELIAGERRFRASRELGLLQLPVIVREASDKDVLEMALIENLQREGLTAIEEARAYQRLAQEFDLKQEDIAKRVGKNRATVANAIRLLDLSAPVQDMLNQGQITTGHAKVLLMLKAADTQATAAQEVVRKSLTVRATEKLTHALLNPPQTKPPAERSAVTDEIKKVEEQLMQRLSTNVNVRHTEKKGCIEIDYYGVEDLNRLLALVGILEEEA